jgi:hypothetical protein
MAIRKEEEREEEKKRNVTCNVEEFANKDSFRFISRFTKWRANSHVTPVLAWSVLCANIYTYTLYIHRTYTQTCPFMLVNISLYSRVFLLRDLNLI